MRTTLTMRHADGSSQTQVQEQQIPPGVLPEYAKYAKRISFFNPSLRFYLVLFTRM